MIFDPRRHERVTEAPWDEAAARAAIATIAGDADAAFDDEALWSRHPNDDDAPGATTFKSLYWGAAGGIWALRHLQARGAAHTRDWTPFARPLIDHYLREPDTKLAVASYWIGETGVLLTAWSLDPDAVDFDYLYRLIQTNISNVANEPLWGGPGTMLAARFLHQRTGEVRWRELFDENVAELLRDFEHDEDAGCELWTQNLYGEILTLVGAGHGFAGNAFALLVGGADAEVKARVARTLQATAVEEGGLVNWPQWIGAERTGRDQWLLQWCHGAPGVITSLCDHLDDDESGRLFAAGGELIWKAGPLAKGPGLCHGTAGNGYAFLKLFRRTGDEQWLGRARRFAMHGIEQSERAREEHGRGRHTLWTGDLGLAVYLLDCIEGTSGVPTLDVF